MDPNQIHMAATALNWRISIMGAKIKIFVSDVG